MSKVPTETGSVLCWPKKVLSADDLRRHLTSQRELLLLPRTIITPLAMDELRAKGVRITSQVNQTSASASAPSTVATWRYTHDKSDARVAAVLTALERDGVAFSAYEATAGTRIAPFAEMLIANAAGGIAIVSEAGVVCCFANKIAGVRAASVESVAQVKSLQKSLGPNLFALAPQGRTFFELKQILRTIASGSPICPVDIATSLQELDGHAHR